MCVVSLGLAHGWTTGVDHARYSIFDRWGRLAQLVRVTLVPVSHSVEVIGAMIGISVLDGHLEVLLEGDRGVEGGSQAPAQTGNDL